MTFTFKGSNPKLKEEVLSMLCNSFEERIKKEAMNNEKKAAAENG